jgi:hypothetical protein
METKTIYQNKFTEYEERTALSVLLGLRMKFAKQLNEPMTYTSKELHSMIDFLLKQVKKRKINSVDLEYAVNPPKLPNDEVWGVINKAIEKSRNKRYNWNLILNGNTLTKEIQLLMKSGKNVNEAYKSLVTDPRIKRFIADFPFEQENLLNVLEISVHARYGEHNSAKRTLEEE